MKKTLIILSLSLALVLVLSGCCEKTETTEQPSTSATGEESFAGTLKDLLSRGESMKCVYSSQDAQGEYSGVTYVAGQKARGDSEIKDASGQITKTHFINDGEWMYTWTTGQSEGMKMKIEDMETKTEEVEDTGETEAPSAPATVDLEQKMDYKCSSWQVDNSVFVPPSDVNFKDWSEEMKAMEAEIEEMKKEMQDVDYGQSQQDLCTACENLPDEKARLDCKINLQCD